MLNEVGSHLKIFITETCDLLIEKLGSIQFDLKGLHLKLQKEVEIENVMRTGFKGDMKNLGDFPEFKTFRE